MVLVETSEEDSFLLVAQHIGELLNDGEQKTALAETPGSRFVEECTALLEDESRFEEFFNKVLKQLDLVFSKCEGKDCECIANLLVNAVARLPEDKAPAATSALAAALTAKLDERADERLSALLNLYSNSSAAGAAVQLPLLLASCEYACKNPRLATIVSNVVRGHAEDWVTAWKLDQAQSRTLYIALASLAKASQGKAAPKEYLRLVTAALALGREGDAAAMEQLKPHAIAAVIDFIRNPTTYQCDLAETPVVKHLGQDKQYAGLVALLRVILAGDMPGFKAAATPAVLEQAGITSEAALYKARMIALLALGGKSAHEELPFSAIEKALDIPADQVELWVVRAIGSKLIEGKIDQVRNVVVISRCTLRTFSSSDWASMRAKLAAWKDALANVQANMASGKAGPAPTGRGTQAIKA